MKQCITANYIVEDLIKEKGEIFIEDENGKRFLFTSIFIENEIVYLIGEENITGNKNCLTAKDFNYIIELEATLEDWNSPAKTCLINEGLSEDEIEKDDIKIAAKNIILNLELRVLLNEYKKNITKIDTTSDCIVLIKTNK